MHTTLAQLFQRTCATLQTYWKEYFTLIIVQCTLFTTVSPVLFLFWVSTLFHTRDFTQTWLSTIIFFVPIVFLVNFVAFLVVLQYIVILETVYQKQIIWKQIFHRIWNVMMSLVGGGVLYQVGIFLGGLVSLIPGFIILFIFQWYAAVIINEKVGVIHAFKMSRELLKGNALEVFVLEFSGLLVIIAGYVLMMMVLINLEVVLSLQLLIHFMIPIVIGIYHAHIYKDLKKLYDEKNAGQKM